MAKSKKPRKKYNPNKNMTETPVMFRYTKSEGNKLKLRYYLHLDNFSTDKACAGDYLSLDFRFKVGLELCKLFDNTEVSTIIEEGLRILEQTKLDRIINSKWTISNETKEELRAVLSLVDDIHDQTTRKEQAPIYVAVEKKLEHQLYETLP